MGGTVRLPYVGNISSSLTWNLIEEEGREKGGGSTGVAVEGEN